MPFLKRSLRGPFETVSALVSLTIVLSRPFSADRPSLPLLCTYSQAIDGVS